jgi:hypothetical protein
MAPLPPDPSLSENARAESPDPPLDRNHVAFRSKGAPPRAGAPSMAAPGATQRASPSPSEQRSPETTVV